MPGEVAHTCNPSNLRARDGEDHGSRSVQQKVRKPPSKSINRAWWLILVTPVMQKAVGRRIMV
jgi:hypothetical protein